MDEFFPPKREGQDSEQQMQQIQQMQALQAQQAQMQAQLEQMRADIEKTRAETEKIESETIKNISQLENDEQDRDSKSIGDIVKLTEAEKRMQEPVRAPTTVN